MRDLVIVPEPQESLPAEAAALVQAYQCASKADGTVRAYIYHAASGIVDAIDGLTEAVTGDRKHLHLTAPTTPGGNLKKPG